MPPAIEDKIRHGYTEIGKSPGTRKRAVGTRYVGRRSILANKPACTLRIPFNHDPRRYIFDKTRHTCISARDVKSKRLANSDTGKLIRRVLGAARRSSRVRARPILKERYPSRYYPEAIRASVCDEIARIVFPAGRSAIERREILLSRHPRRGIGSRQTRLARFESPLRIRREFKSQRRRTREIDDLRCIIFFFRLFFSRNPNTFASVRTSASPGISVDGDDDDDNGEETRRVRGARSSLACPEHANAKIPEFADRLTTLRRRRCRSPVGAERVRMKLESRRVDGGSTDSGDHRDIPRPAPHPLFLSSRRRG